MTRIRDPLTGWTRTSQLNLPYVLPAQAQKHVTVNESLTLLDSMIQLSVETVPLIAPPDSPVEGGRYLVSPRAMGDWADHAGMLAIRQDDGWVYVTPHRGWSAWVADSRFWMTHDGTGWRSGPRRTVLMRSDGGDVTLARVVEGEHTVEAGMTSTTTLKIPARSLLLGVSGVVLEALPGPSIWALGVEGDDQRFDPRIRSVFAARFSALESTPRVYTDDTPLIMTAVGDAFTGGGRIRLALHVLQLAYEGSEEITLPAAPRRKR